jgi:hypothetical protein
MASTNILLTPTIIAREALRLLKNNLVMGSQVYRAYESEFPGSPKKGGTVTIRKPVKFLVTKSRTRATSNISEQSITLTVATQAHVSWDFTAVDLTLSIEEYSSRYIAPAAAILANTVDADLCELYKDIYNVVGYEDTGFITPHTFMVMGRAMQRMDEEAVPAEDRCIVFNPAAHWGIANALTNLYTQNPAEQALRKGFLGRIANCDVYMDQNIKTHTVGFFHDTDSAWTSAVSMGSTAGGMLTACSTGTVPSGTTAVLMCNFRATVGTNLLAIGDWFSIQNVYAVNPMSGESTGSLRQFVVTAGVSAIGTDTASANNIKTVHISPIIKDTGPYKTVSTVPAGGSLAFFWEAPGASIPQNLAFHRNAFALCMVPLEKPDGVSFSSTVSDSGYSIRIVKDYDIDSDTEVIRLDILYGVKTIYPEMAVRITGLTG